MDSIQLRSVKNEKSQGNLKFLRIKVITNVFRLIEVLLFLILISKLSTRLPLAVKSFGEFFKELGLTLVSPSFVFIIGNTIAITLFVKSGRYSNQDSTSNPPNLHVYQEFLGQSETKQGVVRCENENRGKQGSYAELRAFNDVHKHRRTISEKIRVLGCEKYGGKLERSKTEKCVRICDSDEKMIKSWYAEDRMSSEEFRNKIEAFIARQKRIQMDEE